MLLALKLSRPSLALLVLWEMKQAAIRLDVSLIMPLLLGTLGGASLTLIATIPLSLEVKELVAARATLIVASSNPLVLARTCSSRTLTLVIALALVVVSDP